MRFVTAVPIGTPVKSAAVRAALLKYTMLRALLAATSMLNTVLSAMRYRPMIVPSRSATAIAMRAEEPMGRRITARVVFAVAMALLMIAVTSDAASPPSGPAAGATSMPSGGVPGTRRWAYNKASRETACARTGRRSRLVHERQSNAVDEHNAGRGGRGAKSIGSCRRVGCVFRNVGRDSRDSDAAHQAAVAKQRHAAGIDRGRIAVIHVRFARRDAEARRRAADRARGRHRLPGNEICGKRASAIRVFDSVERRVGRVRDSGREMNSADEAHGARGKRRLIVAEKRAGARERNRKFIDVHLRAEISRGQRWRGRLAIDAQDVPGAVHHGNHHRVGISGLRGGLHERRDVGGGKALHGGRRSRGGQCGRPRLRSL